MKTIALLGASGSIGRQTLDIIDAFPAEFRLVGFSVGERIHLIDGILAKHPHVRAITVKDEVVLATLQDKHPAIAFYAGNPGLLELVAALKPSLVVNALVGFVGLAPTIYALENGIDVALANKEALVVGGPLVIAAKKKGRADLIPIDSEHVALDKLLAHTARHDVAKLVLTASGGPLYHYRRDELKHVTPAQALAHPSWSMGPKITIDSATMMNKGFEIIEAHYLFGMPVADIEVWIHPTSRIHSLIQLIDGTYLADLGLNSMHIPISYAMFGRKRVRLPFLKHEANVQLLSLLELKPVPADRFPALDLARAALNTGGSLPCVMNAANEVAVAAFLSGKLRFDYIEPLIEATMKALVHIKHPTLDDLIDTDKAARKVAFTLLGEMTP